MTQFGSQNSCFYSLIPVLHIKYLLRNAELLILLTLAYDKSFKFKKSNNRVSSKILCKIIQAFKIKYFMLYQNIYILKISIYDRKYASHRLKNCRACVKFICFRRFTKPPLLLFTFELKSKLLLTAVYQVMGFSEILFFRQV